MRIRNISPLGDLHVTALGRVVAAGEEVDVADEIGAALIEQASTWAAADTAKEQ